MIYEPEAGEFFSNFIERMKQEMQKYCYRTVKFNGTLLTVSWDSKVDDIVVIYDLTRQVQRLKNGA